MTEEDKESLFRMALIATCCFLTLGWILTEVDNRELEQRIKICGCEQ